MDEDLASLFLTLPLPIQMKIVIEQKQPHQEGCETSRLQHHHEKERGDLECPQAQRERTHVLESVALVVSHSAANWK